MLLKFGSSRISSRETIFFESYCWFKFNNLGLPLGMALKLYTSVAKGLKLKVRKFGKLNPTFVKVIWEKLVRGHPWLLPILNRVKQIWSFQLQVCLSISCHLVDTMPQRVKGYRHTFPVIKFNNEDTRIAHGIVQS